MQRIKKYKILITGVAGFIGSKLATELVNLGHEVTGIDLLKYDKSSINHLYVKKNFYFYQADVTNKMLMKNFLKKKDFIIPLAGLVGAPLCEKNKKEAISVNLNAIKLIIKV